MAPTPPTTRAILIPRPGHEPPTLGALLSSPSTAPGALTCLLAHGAGAGIEAPLLEAIAQGLATTGIPTLRFRYPYMQRMASEGRRRPPDRAPALIEAHRAALAHLMTLFPDARALLGGKSLGARMASLLVAEGAAPAGQFFLGYPLHPARRPETLRSEHFERLACPTLFLQGTRDALCDLALLDRELARFPHPPRVVRVEDADHDFQVPKRSGRTAEELRADLLREVLAWVAELPAPDEPGLRD